MNCLVGMIDKQLEVGFVYYYCDENMIIWIEDIYNCVWYVVNFDGNNSYFGYEVCGNWEMLKVVFL